MRLKMVWNVPLKLIESKIVVPSNKGTYSHSETKRRGVDSVGGEEKKRSEAENALLRNLKSFRRQKIIT